MHLGTSQPWGGYGVDRNHLLLAQENQTVVRVVPHQIHLRPWCKVVPTVPTVPLCLQEVLFLSYLFRSECVFTRIAGQPTGEALESILQMLFVQNALNIFEYASQSSQTVVMQS